MFACVCVCARVCILMWGFSWQLFVSCVCMSTTAHVCLSVSVSARLHECVCVHILMWGFSWKLFVSCVCMSTTLHECVCECAQFDVVF